MANPRLKSRALMVLLPMMLYAAAINPHFLPANYDDTVYYFGAESIAETGTFKLHGKHIVDWPPGFPALLALPFALGLQSVVTAKACVVLCVGVSLLLCWRLFQEEGRGHAVIVTWLFALLPAGFMMGTRIMAEWPYIMMSLLFLLALRRLRTDRQTWGWALLCGVLLGAASLTKFIGVLLGAATVAQMLERWVRARRSGQPATRAALLAEPLVAVVGAAIYLLWKAKIQAQITAGTAAPSDYYYSGWIQERFLSIDVPSVFQSISELFFHAESIGRVFGDHLLIQLLLALPGLIVLLGMIVLFRARKVQPSDWYVISLLLLFSTLKNNQQIRYLLPVAPFLIHYFLLGCAAIWNFVRPRAAWPKLWAFRMATAAWILFLAAAASHLLLRGNLNQTHRGLFFLASPTPESFYRGYWLDLYRVCQRIKADPDSGRVAVLGGDEKYLPAFAEREPMPFDPRANFHFLLVLHRPPLPEEQRTALKLAEIARTEEIILYRKGDEVLHNQAISFHGKHPDPAAEN